MAETPKTPVKSNSRMGLGGWLVVLGLGGLFGGACWYSLYVWQSMGPVDMSATGWATMALGAVFSIALGAGLMGLVFWSHNKGFDR